METSISITSEEFSERVDKLLGKVIDDGLSGAVIFDSHYILYYTGFAFIPTERPIAFVMNSSGEMGLFVPRLEVEHAQSNSLIQRVDHYLEYPYKPHPTSVLKDMLLDMGITGQIGVDHDGYPWILGYRGPDLSELMESRTAKLTGFIEDQMMIKSKAELALIRESVKWGHLAQIPSGQYIAPRALSLMGQERGTGVKLVATQLFLTPWRIISFSWRVISWLPVLALRSGGTTPN
jgi:Xaa-Pro aminopeptidase